MGRAPIIFGHEVILFAIPLPSDTTNIIWKRNNLTIRMPTTSLESRINLIRGSLIRIVAFTSLILCAGANHAHAVNIDGTSPGFYEEGLVYYGNGDYVAAIIQLKNALRANPDFIPARILAGKIFLILGDEQSAEKELRAAQKLGADSNLQVVPLARSYLIRGKFSQLLDEFLPYGRSPEIL